MNNRFESLLVVLIAFHSVAVGAMFLLAPQWTIQFAGWQHIRPVFFAYQAGIFHVVLAAAYVLEYRRYHGVSILIAAKTIAFFFLISATLADPLPWAVWTSGIIDGLMAVAVWWVHRQTAAQPSPAHS